MATVSTAGLKTGPPRLFVFHVRALASAVMRFAAIFSLIAFVCVLAGCLTSGESGGVPPVPSSTFPERVQKAASHISNTVHMRRSAESRLGEMYNRAAQFQDGRRNPVVIIPGILGSRLTDGNTGRVLWGSVGFHAANPNFANDARALALPMDPGLPLSQLRDNSRADAILGDVQVNLFGFPLRVAVYHEILRTLGIGGYRNDRNRTATLDSIDYGDDHFTCFEFHYDWRRSNDENAARLAEFLREKTDYVAEIRRVRYGVEEPVRFDLVAHSMGGLLARYFMRYGSQPLPEDGSPPVLTWEGAKVVETLTMVGTPNAGSVDAFKALVEGAKHSKLVPRYPAAVVGTMSSFYQLMPRPRHSPVIACTNQRALDLYDVRNWMHHEWGLADPRQDSVLANLLPGCRNRSDRRRIAIDHLQKNLSRARQFHAALDAPGEPPPGTSIYLVAGDSEDTNAALEVCVDSGALSVVRQGPGDGTVLRSSALMDERLSAGVRWQPQLVSPIRFDETTFLFADHIGLTSDPEFTDNLLHLLLEQRRGLMVPTLQGQHSGPSVNVGR